MKLCNVTNTAEGYSVTLKTGSIFEVKEIISLVENSERTVGEPIVASGSASDNMGAMLKPPDEEVYNPPSPSGFPVKFLIGETASGIIQKLMSAAVYQYYGRRMDTLCITCSHLDKEGLVNALRRYPATVNSHLRELGIELKVELMAPEPVFKLKPVKGE